MSKTANLYVRIEPTIKEQAENILASLGISASSAINIFYKQIILQRGLPFDVKIPTSQPINISKLSDEEMEKELTAGFVEMEEGKTKPSSEVFGCIKKDYDL